MSTQVSQRVYATPTQLVTGTDIARIGQLGVLINCTVAGAVLLKLPGGNLNVTVPVGATFIHNIEVIGVVSMTATAVVTVLAP